jgi:hypothetical protein
MNKYTEHRPLEVALPKFHIAEAIGTLDGIESMRTFRKGIFRHRHFERLRLRKPKNLLFDIE